MQASCKVLQHIVKWPEQVGCLLVNEAFQVIAPSHSHFERCQTKKWRHVWCVSQYIMLAGGNCEADNWTPYLCQGIWIYLVGLGMLRVFLLGLGFLLVAPLLGVGLFFFGWVAAVAIGESLDMSCIGCLGMVC